MKHTNTFITLLIALVISSLWYETRALQACLLLCPMMPVFYWLDTGYKTLKLKYKG